MSLIEKLKVPNIDRLDIDEAFELVTAGRSMCATYETFQVSPPEWLVDSIAALERDIRSRREDMLRMRLKDVQAKKTALRSREERRAELEAEEARLQRALGS